VKGEIYSGTLQPELLKISGFAVGVERSRQPLRDDYRPDPPVIIATVHGSAPDERLALLIDGYAPPVTVRSEAVAAVCRYPVTLGRLSWGSACVRGSQTMPMSFGWIWGQEE